ncbi:hypothetical protein [Gibbsiella quercinecans]|uniref:hypothetical protein n=1 Tax=Gibbsiella quercinecans TaxID=929813 RepID=UPI0024302F6C|nr:hypothetical protein [Gibbsiella quercinecans]
MILSFSHSFVPVNDAMMIYNRKHVAERVSSTLQAIAEKAICRFYDIPSIETIREQAIQLRMRKLGFILDSTGCPFNVRTGASSDAFEIRDNSTGKVIYWCGTAQVEGDTTDITTLGEEGSKVVLTITVNNEYSTFDGKSEI